MSCLEFYDALKKNAEVLKQITGSAKHNFKDKNIISLSEKFNEVSIDSDGDSSDSDA